MSANTDADIQQLNYQYLMVAQKQLNANPILAKHTLGLDDASASFLSNMSTQEMQKLAHSGVSAVAFRFGSKSIPHLANFVSGDDMAIAQAILGGA